VTRKVSQVGPAPQQAVQLKPVFAVGRYAAGTPLVNNTAVLQGVEWPVEARFLVPWIVSCDRDALCDPETLMENAKKCEDRGLSKNHFLSPVTNSKYAITSFKPYVNVIRV